MASRPSLHHLLLSLLLLLLPFSSAFHVILHSQKPKTLQPGIVNKYPTPQPTHNKPQRNHHTNNKKNQPTTTTTIKQPLSPHTVPLAFSVTYSPNYINPFTYGQDQPNYLRNDLHLSLTNTNTRSPSFLLTGNTHEHKHILQELGGKYNKALKGWMFDPFSLTHAHTKSLFAYLFFLDPADVHSVEVECKKGSLSLQFMPKWEKGVFELLYAGEVAVAATGVFMKGASNLPPSSVGDPLYDESGGRTRFHFWLPPMEGEGAPHEVMSLWKQKCGIA